MSQSPFPSAPYYHVYNSGVERRPIFNSKEDFDRFEAYLYLLNSIESPRVANIFAGNREAEIFTTARGENLVAIGAFSFVPQEFHILLCPVTTGGVGKFMQKLQTAYTMYFNKKHSRSGRLFHSAYRSRKLTSDDELKHAFTYVHLQPSALFDQTWERASGSDLAMHVQRAMQYRFSSASEYLSGEFRITSPKEFPSYIRRAKNAQAHFAWWTTLREKYHL